MSQVQAKRSHKIAVLGSGNWGSAIAKIVAENAAAHPDLFERTVEMWVHEERIQLATTASSQKNQAAARPQEYRLLTTLINELHENVKYLPNVRLPENLHANPDLHSSVSKASILIFNLPHQFMNKLCRDLQGRILPFARGISCIKGVDVSADAISLFSESIGKQLGIYCGALSGANIASEVALEKFSETTIAYDPPDADSRNPTPKLTRSRAQSQSDLKGDPQSSRCSPDRLPPTDVSALSLIPLPQEYQQIDHEVIKTLFHRPYFHVRVVSDVAGVSLGGALKNIIALAAGFVAGLDWGDNAKAAIMRVGLLEMVKFGKTFFPERSGSCNDETLGQGVGRTGNTFLEESAGVADLITSCSGGRNYRCAKMSVEKSVSVETIEEQELNGQKLQGLGTAREVYGFLRNRKMEDEFPLLVATYKILQGEARPEQLPDLIEHR